MTRRRRAILSVVISLGLACCMLVVAPRALAKDIFGEACSGQSQSSTCGSRSTTNPLTGTTGTLYKVSIIIAVIAGLSAIVVIIISGFKYIMSGGDSQKTASAKSTLIGAIVGLAIIVLAQAIIMLVLRSL